MRGSLIVSFAERAQSRPATPPCSLGRIVADLDKSEADALRSMLADPDRPIEGVGSVREAIEEELEITVSDKTIRKHRRGDCRCSDELR